MNHTAPNQHDLQQDRYGLRVAARLSAGLPDLPYDVAERLRASRVQAVGRRKVERVAPATGALPVGGGQLALGPLDEGLGWFTRLASLLPLVALVVGLMTIHSGLEELAADEIAEVDTALLTDDLPPSAYADTGFLQYLKTDASRP
jgi:hypothetical protein